MGSSPLPEHFDTERTTIPYDNVAKRDYGFDRQEPRYEDVPSAVYPAVPKGDAMYINYMDGVKEENEVYSHDKHDHEHVEHFPTDPQDSGRLRDMVRCLRLPHNTVAHHRVQVPADGNCFWHAVGLFFHQREPLKFKTSILKQVLRHASDEAEIQELQNLMQNGKWANNLAVRAVALAMQCRVEIEIMGELWCWQPAEVRHSLRLELRKGHFSLLEPTVWGGGKKGRGQKRKAEPSKDEEEVIYIGCTAEDTGNYTVMITRRSYGWRSAFAQSRWGWLCVVAPDTPLVEVRRVVARSLRVANDRLSFLRNGRLQSWETIVNEDLDLVLEVGRRRSTSSSSKNSEEGYDSSSEPANEPGESSTRTRATTTVGAQAPADGVRPSTAPDSGSMSLVIKCKTSSPMAQSDTYGTIQPR